MTELIIKKVDLYGQVGKKFSMVILSVGNQL